MRIAYIAPYQGPELLQRRPSMLNLGLAGNAKIELISEALQREHHEMEVISQGEVVERQFKLFRGFREPHGFHPDIPVDYASALPIKHLNGLWSSYWTLRLLRLRHREDPFDAVVIYNLKPPQMACALYALRRLKVPVVLEYEDDAFVDIGGRTEHGFVARLYSRVASEILKSVSGLIGVSPYLLSLAPPTTPKTLLRGAINEHILRLTRETAEVRKKWVAFSGTFSTAKGLEPLLRAWDLVDLPDWELHIAGDGEKADLLKRMAAHNPTIVFHGLLNRVQNAEFLRAATIGINPHDLSETPGNVFAFKIIEYLASGNHVITTPMGALEADLEAGLTYMPDNSPSTIAATIQRVIHQEDYKRTAAAAAERRYGPEAVGKALDAFLRQVQIERLRDVDCLRPTSPADPTSARY